jgi:hypothetical protein
MERWWRFGHLGADEFLRKADTGDILLWKGAGFMQQGQRFLTGAEYDHVAVLIRTFAPDGSNKLCIYEAEGRNGVSACYWDQFVKNRWDKLYEKVVWRKLFTNRDEKFKSDFSAFINETIGHGYELNVGKMMKFQSMWNAKEKQDGKDQDRSYFCSELIADCYKRLGFFNANKTAARYWPGDFAQNAVAELTKKNSYLGCEYFINLDL